MELLTYKNLNKMATKVPMKSNKALKPVDSSKNPGLAKLPTSVRNKMGFQKTGGTNKAKTGTSLKPKGVTAANVSKRLGSRLRDGGTLSPTASNVSRKLASPFKKKAKGGATLSPSGKSTSNRLASNLKMRKGGDVKKAMGGYKMMKVSGKCRGGCY